MTVTRAGLDLLAALLTGQRTAPIGWLAVGRGAPAWDAEPPRPDRGRLALVDEVHRMRLGPAAGAVRYDRATRTVRAEITLPPGAATGPLREVGLVAGAASARRGSGVLVNHRVHDLVDKGPGDELRRVVELRLPAGLEAGLADALGGLLIGDPGVGTLIGVAIGTGGGPAGDGGLAAEQLRRTLLPAEVGYDPAMAVVLATTTFDADDLVQGWPVVDGRPAPVREVGLLIGTDLADARLVARSVIDGHDLRLARPLRHRHRLALGDRLDVVVPDLAGVGLAEVADRLGADLVLGRVLPVDRPGMALTVVDQDPPAGATVPQLSAVSLSVVRRHSVLVPNVAGLDQAGAARAIAARGLRIDHQEERILPVGDRRPPAGTVLAVIPPAGTPVDQEAAVVIQVAAFIQAPTPDLRGRTADSAGRVLARAGWFQPPSVTAAEHPATPGTVVSQNPAPGVASSVDTVVELTVATPVTVEVPDLVGQTVTEAESLVASVAAGSRWWQDRGLAALSIGSITVDSRPAGSDDGTRRPGTVLAQQPPAGRPVAVHTAVAVTVAGAASATVPNLDGLTVDAAQAALAMVGLSLGPVTTRAVAEPRGTVVAQSPPAGTTLSAPAAVAVTVDTTVRVPVPDIAGFSHDGVLEILSSRGLVLGEEGSVVVPGAPGMVGRQRPSAGTVVDHGTAVDVDYVQGIPNVVGQPLEQAKQTLAGVGLQCEVERQRSRARADTVLEQDPAPGSPVPNDRTVHVTVSQTILVAVPPLRGMMVPEAHDRCTAAGLGLEMSGTEADAGGIEVGTIARQDPTADAQVEPGTIVRVWVKTPADVKVPDVRRNKLEAAIALIGERSLLHRVGEPVPSSTVTAGTVAEQDPAPGTTVRPGSTVTIRLATAAPVTVPDVRARTARDALEQLANAGLQGVIDDPFDDRIVGPEDASRVVAEQDPRPGALVPVGTAVSLQMGMVMPNLIGAVGETVARSLLRLGFQVEVRTQLGGRTGTITATNPREGTVVAYGAAIILFVGGRFIGRDPGLFDPPVVELPPLEIPRPADGRIGRLEP